MGNYPSSDLETPDVTETPVATAPELKDENYGNGNENYGNESSNDSNVTPDISPPTYDQAVTNNDIVKRKLNCNCYKKLYLPIIQIFILVLIFGVVITPIVFTTLYGEYKKEQRELRRDAECKYGGVEILERIRDNSKEFQAVGIINLDIYSIIMNSTRTLYMYKYGDEDEDFKHSDVPPEDKWTYDYNNEKENSEIFNDLMTRGHDDTVCFNSCMIDPKKNGNYLVSIKSKNFYGECGSLKVTTFEEGHINKLYESLMITFWVLFSFMFCSCCCGYADASKSNV